MSSNNVIQIYFKDRHQTCSKPQYQYNHGQILYFADIDLPEVFEVHFSNSNEECAKSQFGRDNRVQIPDEYFWSGALAIYAWIYLHDGDDDGETIYEVDIPLIKRGEPSDEEIAPNEETLVDRVLTELNYAVGRTDENVSTIENYANQSAENVLHYPTIIDGYWNVWDADSEQFVSTGVKPNGEHGLTVFPSRNLFIIETNSKGVVTSAPNLEISFYAYRGNERVPLSLSSCGDLWYGTWGTFKVASVAISDIVYGFSELIYTTSIVGKFNTQSVTYNLLVDGSIEYPVTVQFIAVKSGEGGVSVTAQPPAVFIPTDSNGVISTAFNKTVTFTLRKGSELDGANWDSNGVDYTDPNSTGGEIIWSGGGVGGSPSATYDEHINIPANCTIPDVQYITATARVSDTESYTCSVPVVAIKREITTQQMNDAINSAITAQYTSLTDYIDNAVATAVANATGG